MTSDSSADSPRQARVTRNLSVSRGLDEVQYYRPGSLVATALVGAPALVGLAAAALTYALADQILVVVPLLLCGWLVTLPVSWQYLVTVRTTSGAIGVKRPRRAWVALAWDEVERATRRGPILTLQGPNATRVRFAPIALRDGARLYRLVLMRLPAMSLDARLREDARALLGEQAIPRPDGGLTGLVSARPRARWRFIAAGLGLTSAVSLALAAVLPPKPVGLPIAVLAAGVVGISARAYIWLLRRVTVTDRGIAVMPALARRSREIAWSEIQLVEHTPGERLIRLRGETRLLCPGPNLLPAASRDGMRAFLHAYCVSQGVPVAQRPWLI